jgi:CRISPR-associated protein Cmr2
MPESSSQQWEYLEQWREKDVCIFALSISPAQEFISEARKSRDLRAGSLLLSWLSLKLYEPILKKYQETAFIIPACAGNPFFKEWKDKGSLELEQLEPLAESGKSITNRAVGLIERDQLYLLDEGKENCRTAWNEYADCCKERLINCIRQEKWQQIQKRWEKQMQDFSAAFSIYAVAADADLNNLRSSIQKIIDQMERRKDSRLFNQWQGEDMPKCTQCGHREIIAVKDDPKTNSVFWQRINSRYSDIIRIEDGRELLCACCLAKRLFAFDKEVFLEKSVKSTVEIAATSFLDEFREIAKTKPDDFQLIMWDWQKAVKKHYDKCPEHDSFTADSWLKKIAELVLPYELDDDRKTKDSDAKIKDNNLRKKIESANNEYLYSADKKKSLGLIPPSPYLAVLMLDGDNMGEILSKNPGLSSDLTDFSKAVPGIIENEKHQGLAIYSSGDELLALLPKDSALSATKAVQKEFEERIKKKTTCSAAITWFHCKSPLLQAIRNCREGLHEAKEKFCRNSLVCTALVSSASHRFGMPWTEQSLDMAAAIENFVWMLGPEGSLSKNFLHDLLTELPAFTDKSSSEEKVSVASDLLLPRMRYLWKRHSEEKTPARCACEDCCQVLVEMASNLTYVNNKAENFAAYLRIANFLARS